MRAQSRKGLFKRVQNEAMKVVLGSTKDTPNVLPAGPATNRNWTEGVASQSTLLVALSPSNMRVCLRDRSAQTIFTCCHAEIEVADQTFHLTQSQYTGTRPISPSTDPITPGAWQGSHWSANFEVTGMTHPGKISA